MLVIFWRKIINPVLTLLIGASAAFNLSIFTLFLISIAFWDNEEMNRSRVFLMWGGFVIGYFGWLSYGILGDFYGFIPYLLTIVICVMLGLRIEKIEKDGNRGKGVLRNSE